MVGIKIGLIIALAFFSTQVFALTVTGSSVTVHQGDTFTIKSISPDEKLYKVRLSDVDTPELKQPFGIKAKEFTAAQTFGKEIRVEYQLADFYGRLIGEVILPGGKVLNEELVRNGLAWHYRVGTSPSTSLERLQYEAWEKKLGIWVELSPMPPWQFRRENVIPLPPVEENQMDYDLILNYGIIGDPKRKIYWWPACKDYPGKGEKGDSLRIVMGQREQKKENIIFGYRKLAEDMGFRSSAGCTQ